MTTPLEISIALWYYARSGDYGDGNGDNNFNAPAVQEAITRFMDSGLLRPNEPNDDLPQRFVGTEALRVYVQDGLGRVNFPIQKWIIPESSPSLASLIKAGMA